MYKTYVFSKSCNVPILKFLSGDSWHLSHPKKLDGGFDSLRVTFSGHVFAKCKKMQSLVRRRRGRCVYCEWEANGANVDTSDPLSVTRPQLSTTHHPNTSLYLPAVIFGTFWFPLALFGSFWFSLAFFVVLFWVFFGSFGLFLGCFQEVVGRAIFKASNTTMYLVTLFCLLMRWDNKCWILFWLLWGCQIWA